MSRIEAVFEPKTRLVAIEAILPVKRLTSGVKTSRRYQMIADSIAEVGIIEPPVVFPDRQQPGTFLLLDGHLRVEILKDRGESEVFCLIATDDEAFTYNKRINRLAAIQEHFMIVRAIKLGVSEQRIARALGVNVPRIRQKRALLHGICPEVVELLKDKHNSSTAMAQVVNEAEAQTVRTISQLYLELGCARRVKEAADRQGLVTKYRRCGKGKTSGGVAFTRGRIYHLLANPIYVGEIRHKRLSYPGQHPAIIDRATFEAVNRRLKANARRVKAPTSAATHAPLVGKLTDETGQRLTPSHAVRRGKRYCYHVSRRLVAGSDKSDMRGWRLPAAALERAVAGLIIGALGMPSVAQGLIADATPELLTKLLPAARSLCAALSGPDRGPTLRAIVASARIEPGLLSVTLCPIAVAERLDLPPAQINRDALSFPGEFTLRRRGVEAKLVLANTPAALDRTLLKSVALSWAWFEEIKAGATMQAIADREGITQRRVADLVDLAFLAPDIVCAIVEGRQPPTLTADRLVKSKHRMLWSDQRAWLSVI